MAKTSAIQRNLKVIGLVNKFLKKRKELKKIIKNKELPLDERFNAQLKLAKLPRSSSKTRIRNRCEMTGRPRGVYRKLKISRIALRELASQGIIPGILPLDANSLSAILEILSFLYTPRGLPVISHLFLILVNMSPIGSTKVI